MGGRRLRFFYLKLLTWMNNQILFQKGAAILDKRRWKRSLKVVLFYSMSVGHCNTLVIKQSNKKWPNAFKKRIYYPGNADYNIPLDNLKVKIAKNIYAHYMILIIADRFLIIQSEEMLRWDKTSLKYNKHNWAKSWWYSDPICHFNSGLVPSVGSARDIWSWQNVSVSQFLWRESRELQCSLTENWMLDWHCALINI